MLSNVEYKNTLMKKLVVFRYLIKKKKLKIIVKTCFNNVYLIKNKYFL